MVMLIYMHIFIKVHCATTKSLEFHIKLWIKKYHVDKNRSNLGLEYNIFYTFLAVQKI